jgi:hypothetical protein
MKMPIDRRLSLSQPDTTILTTVVLYSRIGAPQFIRLTMFSRRKICQ